MLSFFKTACTHVFKQVAKRFRTLFSRGIVDETALKELKQILIEADTGSVATKHVIDSLTASYSAGTIKNSSDLQNELINLLSTCLNDHAPLPKQTNIYLLVGVNGTGKTTLAAKIAYQEKKNGKKVLLVAADTFRAAAQEQLAQWAEKLSLNIIQGKTGSDPSSIVFSGCQTYTREKYDILIIDTAGRMQTKANLMKELTKIKRVISAQLPTAHIHTILTIDSMLGQNSFEQARVFHASTQIDSFVITKMDGSGKGGIVFALMHDFHIPISYITYGEQPEQLKEFESNAYIRNLLDLD
jgi:fused signal recognition particle receptor